MKCVATTIRFSKSTMIFNNSRFHSGGQCNNDENFWHHTQSILLWQKKKWKSLILPFHRYEEIMTMNNIAHHCTQSLQIKAAERLCCVECIWSSSLSTSLTPSHVFTIHSMHSWQNRLRWACAEPKKNTICAYWW